MFLLPLEGSVFAVAALASDCELVLVSLLHDTRLTHLTNEVCSLIANHVLLLQHQNFLMQGVNLVKLSLDL